MYAIIRAGGKQTKVSEGDIVDVERVKTEGEITFVPLLVVEKNGAVISDRKKLAKVKVTAEVLGESSGPKVDIFKYKAKTGYRKRAGHRQTYTQLRIKKIAMPGSKEPAKKSSTSTEKPAAKKSAAAAEKPAAKKSAAAAEKPAGKKSAAAAEKPAGKKSAAAAEKPAAKKTKNDEGA